MLRLIFVALILVTGFGAMTLSRFAGLLFYLWYAMFRPEAWVYVDLASLRLSATIGGFFILSSFLTHVFPRVKHPISIAMLGFLATTVLGQFSAVRPDVGWEWIGYLGKLILICLMLMRLADSPKKIMLVATVISASFAFHSAKAGLAALIAGGAHYYEGTAGAFLDNNGYALGIVMVIPFLIATAQNISLFVGEKSRFVATAIKAAFLIMALLSVYTVVNLFSRGGFLGLIAMASTFMLLQRRRILAFCFAVIVLVLCLRIVPLPNGWEERMQTIDTYEDVQDRSALSRLHFWKVALDMMAAHPLFGVGLRNYDFTYDSMDFSGGKYGVARSVHSSYFQVLAETGLVGTSFYIFLFLYSIRITLRIRSRSKRENIKTEWQKFFFTMSTAVIASIVGFLIGGSFIALALNDITWFTFAITSSLHLVFIQVCHESAERMASRSNAEMGVPSVNLGLAPSV